MQLPKPYPDELVGSVLMRGSRWTGLAFDRLIRHIAGKNVTSHSMLTTSHGAIASACGLTPMEMVKDHTLFPYAVSFLPSAERQVRLESFGRFGAQKDFGSLAQKLVRDSTRLKYCPECANDDLRLFGESYWHRLHQLDGYLFCTVHASPLRQTLLNIRTRRQVLPSEARSISRPIEINADPDKVANLSAGVREAMNWDRTLPDDLQAHYFELSGKYGYQVSRRRIAAKVFSEDVLSFFGQTLLAALGCLVRMDQVTGWPARMLRKNPTEFMPLKHVLLNQFFRSQPVPSVDVMRRLHGPRPRKIDYAEVDQRALKKMRAEAQAANKTGTMALVEDLLRSAGIASLIKHKRDSLPLVDEFIRAQRELNRNKRWSR